MDKDKAIEDAIKELIALSKRTPLHGEDQERARELMIFLKEKGYTNRQISILLGGRLSERTSKSLQKMFPLRIQVQRMKP